MFASLLISIFFLNFAVWILLSAFQVLICRIGIYRLHQRPASESFLFCLRARIAFSLSAFHEGRAFRSPPEEAVSQPDGKPQFVGTSPILDSMGYESLSTVVVLVIVAIIIVVWLPVRTANGMKRVDEHRQDRYSPSLHIVDAENGRRFGDIKPHKAKGAAMPASTPSARLTSEHIAHVRELRRAAIRRRQILAVCLLAITVLVFAVSFPLHFSPLLALIPFVLLLLVLVLGANASRQARQWERKVVRYERAHSGTGWSKKPSAESKDSKRVNKAEPVAAVTAPAEKPAEQIEDAATEVMEQRQIRRALRDAEIEQAKAKALRQSAAAYQAAAEHAKQSEKSDTAQSAADKPAAVMSIDPNPR